MVIVIPNALTGSPLADWTWNGAKKGMMPSLLIAWSNLGAPVSDCNPAPIVDRRAPISTTLGWGQAMLPTTRLPPILSPNLKGKIGHVLSMIPLARPTVPPVAMIIFTRCFYDILKSWDVGTYVRT